MRKDIRSIGALSALFAAAPSICFAETLSSLVGLFNIMVGLVLAAALLFYGAGMVLWVLRLGTFPTYRDKAIDMLQWAVAILFVLIVLLAIVQFTQNHTREMLIVIAVIVLFFVVRLIARSGGGGHEGEDEGH